MAKEVIKTARDFPSVELLVTDRRLAKVIGLVPRPVAVRLVRESVAAQKKLLKETGESLSVASLLKAIEADLVAASRREITQVVNATGIVMHTNLGRSPLDKGLFEAVKQTLSGYSSLEFDLAGGNRGKRGEASERYLATLAGSEGAAIVNNCAAALFLILNSLANRKKVIISRSELIQIGGGFRIPDILKKSGARLCEIGTTNITSLQDYSEAADEATTVILKVHRSNFVQSGFTDEVGLKELVGLGKERQLEVVNDLGSGVLVPTKKILGYNEPTVQQSVRAGAALTCFSGDKLLGGVQSGLIVGRADLIARIRKNPLFRTMRADKIALAMLEHLFTSYLNGSYISDIKLWRLLTRPESELYTVAKKIVRKAGSPDGLSVEATEAFVGGGALPQATIPSVAVVFASSLGKATSLMRRFRRMKVPIIGRIEQDRFILDLKAVGPEEIEQLTAAIKSVLD